MKPLPRYRGEYEPDPQNRRSLRVLVVVLLVVFGFLVGPSFMDWMRLEDQPFVTGRH